MLELNNRLSHYYLILQIILMKFQFYLKIRFNLRYLSNINIVYLIKSLISSIIKFFFIQIFQIKNSVLVLSFRRIILSILQESKFEFDIISVKHSFIEFVCKL
jgi:hypothetical protein